MSGWSSGRFGSVNKVRRGGRRPPVSTRPRTVADVCAAVVKLKADLRQGTLRVLREQEDILLELQRDQLYAGLTARGEHIRPFYSEDNWFKSKESAERYARWKASLDQRTPASWLPARPTDVPNLIITGTLVYDRLVARTNLLGVTFELPSFPVEKKYGPVLGLSPVVLDYYRRTYFAPEFAKVLRRLKGE